MQIYVSDYIPERFLCLRNGSLACWSPLRSLRFVFFSQSSFVFASQLNTPLCLLRHPLLLQAHLSPHLLEACDARCWGQRWMGERCREDPLRASNLARMNKPENDIQFIPKDKCLRNTPLAGIDKV